MAVVVMPAVGRQWPTLSSASGIVVRVAVQDAADKFERFLRIGDGCRLVMRGLLLVPDRPAPFPLLAPVGLAPEPEPEGLDDIGLVLHRETARLVARPMSDDRAESVTEPRAGRIVAACGQSVGAPRARLTVKSRRSRPP